MIVLFWIDLLVEPPDGKSLKGSGHALSAEVKSSE